MKTKPNKLKKNVTEFAAKLPKKYDRKPKPISGIG